MNFIGVDGGGTKIMYCLQKGNERCYIKNNQCANPNTAGFDNSIRAICSGLIEICEKNNIDLLQIDSIFAGIAGATTDDYKSLLSFEIKKAFPNAAVEVSHDGENIIYAAFPDTDGVIVICGTGSSCFVKKDGKIHRIGGYGVFDLDGNGYEIGRRAVAYTLRTYDGREKRTLLCDKIEEAVGGNCLDNLSKLIGQSNKVIASYAKAVFEAAEEGDEAAKSIIFATAAFIANYINSAARFFDGEKYNVCIAGSVGCNDMTFEMIKSLINSNANIFRLTEEPVNGALEKAKRFIDTSDHYPNNETLEALKEADRISADPDAKGYTDLDELFKDLKK